jgi:hypothetical protein
LTSGALRRWFILGVGIAAVLAFVILDVPLMIEDKIWEGPHANGWIFWLQTASGNWAPTPRPDFIAKRWFAVSASLAFFLNNSLYLAIIALIWQNARDRRKRMTLREALDAFEIAARAQLISRFADPAVDIRDAVSKIDEGLAEGRKEVLPIIDGVWGPGAGKAWTKAQDREITSS